MRFRHRSGHGLPAATDARGAREPTRPPGYTPAMTWFDLGALALVALAVADAARGGLAWAVMELGLLTAAAFLAALVAGRAEPYVQKVFDVSPTDLPWATHAFALALAVTLLMGAAFLLQPLTKRWRFRHDGWAGAAVGIGTGALAALLLFSLAVWSSPRPYEMQLRPSATADALVAAYDHGFAPLFPQHLGHRIEDLRTP